MEVIWPDSFYHIDEQEVKFHDIPDGEIKSLFANMRDAIDSNLHSQQCRIHHSEPTVTLVSKNGLFSGYGFGACCDEFHNIIEPLMKVNIPGVDSEATRLTRTVEYSSMG